MLKRLLLAVPAALALMSADVVALVLVTRAFLPSKPPPWATAVFFWALAWPGPLLTRLFPRAAADPDRGPSLLAVGAGGLIDLLILTWACQLALERWQLRRARAAGPGGDGAERGAA